MMTHFTAAVIPELPKIVPRRPIERASDIEEKRGREGGRDMALFMATIFDGSTAVKLWPTAID